MKKENPYKMETGIIIGMIFAGFLIAFVIHVSIPRGQYVYSDMYISAMNQLANYKCQEQQYEVMEHTCIDTIIRAAGNATICHGTAMIVNNSLVCDNIECHNTYTYKNFTTGRFLPEENKIECLGENKYPNCGICTKNLNCVSGYDISCYGRVQKFTLEEIL